MSSYLNTVLEFNNSAKKLDILKSYEGRIDQKLVKDFTAEIETQLEALGNDLKTIKKVFHVTVEMLQNVCKHSDNGLEKVKNVGEGVFVLATDSINYYIRIGNISKISDVNVMSKNLDDFNPLDQQELKTKYKELIKASRISDKGGAGLGLIDIIKKTKKPVLYERHPIDSNYTFFLQQATVEII